MHRLLEFLNTKSLAQSKILLVEDCQEDTMLAQRMIEDYCSYSLVHHVETKADACIALTNGKYEIILLDLDLPDTTSIADVQKIRCYAPETPLIVVTGTPTKKVLGDVKNYGADGIINKSALTNLPFSAPIERAVDNIASY